MQRPRDLSDLESLESVAKHTVDQMQRSRDLNNSESLESVAM